MGSVFSGQTQQTAEENLEKINAEEAIRYEQLSRFKEIYYRHSVLKDHKIAINFISLIIQHGRVQFLKFLIQEGLDVHMRDPRSKNNLLHICSDFPTTKNILECCNVLIAHKVNINGKNVWGRTPLVTALVAFHNDLAKNLIMHGADVNISDDDNGLSPVILCSSYGNIEMLEILVKNGGNINHTNFSGKSSLHYAIVGNHSEVVSFLLDKKCDINTTDRHGITPLHVAMAKFNTDLAKKLIESGKSKSFLMPYVDFCLKLVWSNGINCTVPNPVLHVLENAMKSITCMKMVVMAFGYNLNKTVLEKLKRLHTNISLNSEKPLLPEVSEALASLQELLKCVQKATVQRANNPRSLQNICIHRYREIILDQGTNVICAAQQLVDIPKYTVDLLTLQL